MDPLPAMVTGGSVEAGTQALAQAALGPGASGLHGYLGAIRRIPPLSPERERSLGRDLRDRNDIAAARALIAANLRHVVGIARRFLGYGLPLGDLVQEGTIGLMKAVRRFDPDKGTRLMAFAEYWIRAEIIEYVLRNWSIVRIGTTKAQRKLFFRLRSSKPDAGRLSRRAAAQVAAALGVAPGEALAMDARLAARDASLDARRGPECDGEPLLESLRDPVDAVDELTERDLTRHRVARLRRALPALDGRSRDIIQKRWLGGDRKTELRTLAREHRVSVERVRQIQNAAFARLRQAVA